MTAKADAYGTLVAERKQCALCPALINPASDRYAEFDSLQVGPWSRWQGNLDAEVMIVGQDWGDTRYYEDNKGREAERNPTNETLIKLLTSIGIAIDPPSSTNDTAGKVFLTNAILCLKQEGGLQGPVLWEWFENCGAHFLKPTIEIISPRVLITLGENAFRAVQRIYGLEAKQFRAAVEQSDGYRLPGGVQLFPMYHCGARILNTHRKYEAQVRDWERVKRCLEAVHRPFQPTTRTVAQQVPSGSVMTTRIEAKAGRPLEPILSRAVAEAFALIPESDRTLVQQTLGLVVEAEIEPPPSKIWADTALSGKRIRICPEAWRLGAKALSQLLLHEMAHVWLTATEGECAPSDETEHRADVVIRERWGQNIDLLVSHELVR